MPKAPWRSWNGATSAKYTNHIGKKNPEPGESHTDVTVPADVAISAHSGDRGKLVVVRFGLAVANLGHCVVGDVEIRRDGLYVFVVIQGFYQLQDLTPVVGIQIDGVAGDASDL